MIEEWVMNRLGSVADIIDPHPSHRAPPESSNGIPFIGIGDISVEGSIDMNSARLVDDSVFEEHKLRYNLDDGLIGIGRVASIGKVVRLNPNIGKFVVSPTIAVIKGKGIDINFLFYGLSSTDAKIQFDKISNGSTRQSVGMNVLRDIRFKQPSSFEEQRAIAAILSDMDAEIAALEAHRKKTRALKQGMMQELLTGRIRLVKGAEA